MIQTLSVNKRRGLGFIHFSLTQFFLHEMQLRTNSSYHGDEPKRQKLTGSLTYSSRLEVYHVSKCFETSGELILYRGMLLMHSKKGDILH